MIKPIKFDLKLSNSERLCTLDDLKNNLTSELFEHFYSGKLAKWLRVRKLEEQADAVEKLLAEIHDCEVQSFKSLIELFGGEADVDSLRIKIAERKKVLPSSNDEIEQLKAEINALKVEIEPIKKKQEDEILQSHNAKSNLKTVRQLSDIVKIPLNKLLIQLKDAGLGEKNPEDKVSEDEKLKFLAHLRQRHG